MSFAPHNNMKGSKDVTMAETSGEMEEGIPGSGTVRLSKTLAVEIKGTLNGFSIMGPEAATWKPVQGKHASIFGMDDGSSMPATLQASSNQPSSMMLSADLSAATASLKNATILKATLLQSHNTFPVPLGVSINCLPHSEVVDTGDKYTFTTIPNTSVNVPSVLYEAGEAQTEAALWRKAFPTFNGSNLETQGVLNIDNCPYVFINQNHPAVNLMRVNKQALGVDIDTATKMDDEWYKVAQPLFQTACQAIRGKILSKIATQDLANFQVTH